MENKPNEQTFPEEGPKSTFGESFIITFSETSASRLASIIHCKPQLFPSVTDAPQRFVMASEVAKQRQVACSCACGWIIQTYWRELFRMFVPNGAGNNETKSFFEKCPVRSWSLAEKGGKFLRKDSNFLSQVHCTSGLHRTNGRRLVSCVFCKGS